jgi:hypothetical protein
MVLVFYAECFALRIVRGLEEGGGGRGGCRGGDIRRSEGIMGWKWCKYKVVWDGGSEVGSVSIK